MKALVLLCLLCAVAIAQPTPPGGLTRVNHDASLTGDGKTLTPIGVRLATGGGLQGGGAVTLGLLTTCGSGEVLKWNGSAWACATAGAITGTVNHLVKVDSSGAAGVDSSVVDDGAKIALTEPVVRTLSNGVANNTDAVLTMVTASDPTHVAAPYLLTSAEGVWTNEPGGAPYWIHDLILGKNYNGSVMDPTHFADWLQFESEWWETNWSPATWGVEAHLSTQAPGGPNIRWISRTSLDDGRGFTSYTANEHTFTDNNTTTPIADFTSTVSQFSEKVQVNSDDASNALAVHTKTGNAQLFRVGADAELDVPISVNTSGAGGLTVQNILSSSATASINLLANNGAKTATIEEGGDSSFVLRNSATGGSTYVDNQSGGFNMRNSSFSNVLTVSDAGSVDAPLGRVSGLKIRTNGSTGPAWTGGTGVPSASCAVGDEFSRTDGAAGTVLYTCTATNTWTAMGGGSGTITGSGTANTTTKFTGTSAIGNAWALDDGTTWGVSAKFTITEATGAFVASSTGSIGGALNMNSHLINNVTDPASAQDAATKAYVDAHAGSTISGLTTGTLPVAASSSTIADSVVTQASSLITIAASLPSSAPAMLTVANTGTSGGSEIDLKSKSGGGTVITALWQLDSGGNMVFRDQGTGASGMYFDYSNSGAHFRNASSSDMLTLSGTGATAPGTLTSTGAFTASSTAHVVGAATLDSTLRAGISTIGGSAGTSSITGTALIVSNAGQTNLAIRDTTDSAEIEAMVNATAAYIGTSTSTGLHLIVAGSDIVVLGGAGINVTGGIGATGTVAGLALSYGNGGIADGGTLYALASGTIVGTRGATSGSFTATAATDTVTFGGSASLPNVSCVISTNGTVKSYSYVESPTGITFASLTIGQKYDFDCKGH